MITALGRIDVEQDFQLVVERWEDKKCQNYLTNMKKKLCRHKTGECPPYEMEYVELQRGESGSKLGVQTNRRRAV